ncbi:MAG: enoyl-CoA hydratase/carnithine racemase [Cocleimonas sp.]|jgi:enoyl-CoA hydratase/carnithine racemase
MPDTQDTEIIIKELTDSGVLRLTLNDNGRRNALSEAMLKSLGEVMNSTATDPSVRVIVLAANGPAFCAGHDLKEMTAGRDALDNGRAYFTKVMETCSSMMQSIVNNPKPVIAEVTGIATAAGCQLVASCDLAYAAETAKFSTPGVHIGLFCSTPMVALSRTVSNKHAMEMLLTGDMVSPARAVEIGLINQVTSEDSLSNFTMEIAEKIASKSSMTMATGKKAFYEQRELSLEDAYAYASQVMVDNMLKHDAEEGIQAFIEKRRAQWQDK